MGLSHDNYLEMQYVLKTDQRTHFAFISPSGEPDPMVPTEIKEIFLLIVTNEEYIEESERKFESLDAAIAFTNQYFSHAKLVYRGSNPKESGCDSCSAH